MKYNIKAIPTTYAGVNFRSRLEARWAAFFDLCGWEWDYEPFDLDGWAPDFKLRRGQITALAEVKPVDLSSIDWGSREQISSIRDIYRKVQKHWQDHQVLMLGIGPMCEPVAGQTYIVGFTTTIPAHATYGWDDLVDHLIVEEAPDLWRQAGNASQWKQPTYSDIAFVRACAAKHKAAA